MRTILEPYRLLQTQLQLDHELPVTPDWSAAADFLFLIKDYCLETKPETIVECSSGLTTITLARCCQLNQKGRVFSLENGESYAIQSRGNLQDFGLSDYATVIHAPLENIHLDHHNYDWYQIKDLPDTSIDMLVIDGPPGFIQKHSRYPALPLLFDKMSKKSVIFMDDAAREDEKEIVNMWLKLKNGIQHQYIETERGCSIFNINKL